MTTLTMRNTGSTDHISFDAVGIPGFQFIQDGMDYGNLTHHSNVDSYEHIRPDDLKQAATIMADFVYNAAMCDEMIRANPSARTTLPPRRSRQASDLFRISELSQHELFADWEALQKGRAPRPIDPLK